MAISHELSSEIATALFAAKERSPHELNDLKEIVFEIHSTLQKFTDEDRLAREARADSETRQLTDPPEARAKAVGNDC
jgi:hypothetical protein